MPGTFTSGRISPAFRERILLAVTSVNRYRYCQWVHSDLAAANGSPFFPCSFAGH